MIDRNRRADRYILSLNPVLYLPFYKYGSEQQKIWDMSQYGNHGTIVGATPAQIPMLSGIELVTNGGFETDPNVEWYLNDCTIASVAGGISGNCLEITRVGEAVQYITRYIPLIAGHRYKISGWFKAGTSGNEYGKINLYDGATQFSIDVNVSASWVYYETFFVASLTQNGTLSLQKVSATAGTMLFDSISIQEVTGYTGGGWQMDGVDDYTDHGNISFIPTTMTLLSWMNIGQNTEYNELWGNMSVGGADGIRSYLYIGDIISKPLHTIVTNVGNFKNDIKNHPLLDLNKFYLVGYQYNGSKITPIVDGELITAAQGVATGTIIQGGTNFFIGKSLFSSFSKQVQGEFGLFDYSLSAQEIRNIYELTRHRYGK